MGKILMFNSKTEEDVEISLAESFNYIDQVPTNENSTEAFVGFVNEKEEVIQFLRHSDDKWLFDIPLQDLETKKWINKILQLDGITTALVKRIVENFFVDDDLIDKIKSKYILKDAEEIVEDTVYVKIDPAFTQWVEKHNKSDELYS